MIRNMQKLFDLSGKAAVITGAGAGLGQGIAEGYAQLGAGVSVVDVNPETAQGVADGIKAQGGEAISVPCDVTQQDQVQAAVANRLFGTALHHPARELESRFWRFAVQEFTTLQIE